MARASGTSGGGGWGRRAQQRLVRRRQPLQLAQAAGQVEDGVQATAKNLNVVRSDSAKGILMVRGAVPGNEGILLKVHRQAR